MKKSILSIVLCAMGLTALAQTDFRHISFDEAMVAAKQENKLVFIDFYTDWCGPCKMMARDVFPQKNVGDFLNEKFVCVKLNAEKDGKEQAARFQVKAYPTFLVLNTKEEIQLEMKGAMDADAFMAKVAAGLNPEMTPARMEARYQSGERTPELVNSYAMYKMEQDKEAEGFRIINDYYASLTDEQRVAAPNVFLFTRYTLDINDEKAKFMVAHRDEFDASVRGAVMERIGRLYNSALTAYFSGYILSENKYKEEDYVALKKDIQDLGLEAEGKYAPMFRLIECRVKSDDATFLSMCGKEYDTLSESARNLLIINMTRLIETDDKEMLKGMSRFIRERLSGLKPSTISLSGRILDGIESKLSKR